MQRSERDSYNRVMDSNDVNHGHSPPKCGWIVLMWFVWICVALSVTGFIALYYEDLYKNALPHVLWGSGIVWAGTQGAHNAIIAAALLIAYQWAQDAARDTRSIDIGEYTAGFAATLGFVASWKLLTHKLKQARKRPTGGGKRRDW